jgi:hypothetical protein
MDDWIPFAQGEYLTEQSFLLASGNRSVALEDAVIEVFKDASGTHRLRGRARIRTILMVELLEEDEDLDIVLDFGAEFKYRLKNPKIQGGKVFAPDVRSTIVFLPTAPWGQIPVDDFEKLMSRLRFLTD